MAVVFWPAPNGDPHFGPAAVDEEELEAKGEAMSSEPLIGAGTPGATPTAEDSWPIIARLLERSQHMTPKEMVKMVYNEAIDDAANFARDLAPHNPLLALTLRAVERELRYWLVLR